jgi:cyclin B
MERNNEEKKVQENGQNNQNPETNNNANAPMEIEIENDNSKKTELSSKEINPSGIEVLSSTSTIASNGSYNLTDSIEKQKERATNFIYNVEYSQDIYDYLILDEKNANLKIKRNYMENQNEINQVMRSILIDWIIEVHNRFHFKTKTLFQTVYIIDLYLSYENIEKRNFQLLGVASLLIACKENEIYVPNPQQFIEVTDFAYQKKDLLKMEKKIMHVTKFEILIPTAEEFYNIISKKFNFTENQYELGNYFLDSSLVSYDLLIYQPSTIAVACAYIVMKFYQINGYRDLYSPKMTNADYPQKTIKDCARDLCRFVKNLSNSTLLAAKVKYSSVEHGNVAAICEGN